MNPGASQGVLETVRAINGAGSDEAVLRAFARFASQYGFEQIFLGRLASVPGLPPADLKRLSRWLMEFRSMRQREQLIEQDPVVRLALTSGRAVRWGEPREKASEPSGTGRAGIHDFSRMHGVMFAMHSLEAAIGGVSLAARQRPRLPGRQIAELEIVSQTAYFHLSEKSRHLMYQLAAVRVPETASSAAGMTEWRLTGDFSLLSRGRDEC